MTIKWLTTAPNPRSPATGFDAGQRGWRVHAVDIGDSKLMSEIKKHRALCGLKPAHGWGMDLFIDTKCSRCLRIIEKGKEQTS